MLGQYDPNKLLVLHNVTGASLDLLQRKTFKMSNSKH